MTDWHSLESELEHRRQLGLYRQRRVTDSAQGVLTTIDGQPMLSFCSNDYLGLANHPDIKQAFIEAAQQYGVGSGSAHLVNGHSALHHQCEETLAEFTGRERALLFSTGYMANLAVATALTSRHDVIFQDKLNHASLIDAARLSDAAFVRYRHNDLEQLQRLIDKHPEAEKRRLIMADAVFSMDGDTVDAVGLSRIAESSESWLMLDDAHGIGVLGENGAGLCEQVGLSSQQVPILMATLGKAVGVSGAFVAGDETLIEGLIQNARSYIFTTASPPAQAAAIIKSIDIIRKDKWRRDTLAELIDYLKQRASAAGLQLMPSDTAIQPLVIGDNHRTVEISRRLFEQGLHVTAIRPPTVPENSARLRITLSAAHEKGHIDRLIEQLSHLLLL